MSWIKFEDQLPPMDEEVLICTQYQYVNVGIFYQQKNRIYFDYNFSTYGGQRAEECLNIYWMPITTLPERLDEES